LTRKRLLRPDRHHWRLGCNARTIHAQIGDQPSDHDPMIGVMDSRGLAEAVIRAHNLELAGELATERWAREPE